MDERSALTPHQFPTTNAALLSYLQIHRTPCGPSTCHGDIGAPPSSQEDRPTKPRAEVLLQSLARYPLPIASLAAATSLHGFQEAPPQTVQQIRDFFRSVSSLPPQNVDGDATSSSDGISVAPSMAALSPFRWCGTPAFHHQLQRLQWMTTSAAPAVHFGLDAAPWSCLDALCHGWRPAPAAQEQRKRRRETETLPSTPSLASSSTLPGSSNVAIIEGSASCPAAAHMSQAVRQQTSGITPELEAGSLRGRLDENATLLSSLLETVPCMRRDTAVASYPAVEAITAATKRQYAATMRPMTTASASVLELSRTTRREQEAVEVTSDPTQRIPPPSFAELEEEAAVEKRDNITTTASGCKRLRREETATPTSSQMPSPLPSASTSLPRTLKALREVCIRHGLLTTGSKSILERRVALFFSSPTHRPAFRSGSGEANARRTPSPPPRVVEAVQQQQQHQSNGHEVAMRPLYHGSGHRAVSASSSSSSPPRTVFRYCSGDSPPPSCSNRVPVVPSSAAFLADFIKRSGEAVTSDGVNATAAPLASSPRSAWAATRLRATRAFEEEVRQEMEAMRWQWLIDHRERATGGGRRHDGMVEAFQRQQVPCTSYTLPCGDFALAVDLSEDEKAKVDQWRCSATEVSPVATPPAAMQHLCSHLFSFIVERKTMADLDASVKGGRYLEQRRLLSASPFQLVIWLVEGVEMRPTYYRPRSAAQTVSSSSPPPQSSSLDLSISGEANISDRQRTTASTRAEDSSVTRVESACASLSMFEDGWVVIRTRNMTESVAYLKQLALQRLRQLAISRIAGRRRSSSGSEEPLAALPVTGAVDGMPLPGVLGPTHACLEAVGRLQRQMRAATAFPRMLMSVRGCSSALALSISMKYGCLLDFWRELRSRGGAGCDADADIQRLTTAQKKVFVLLTEFLLAKEYY